MTNNRNENEINRNAGFLSINALVGGSSVQGKYVSDSLASGDRWIKIVV